MVRPICGVVVFLAVAGLARADDRALAREHFRRGSKAFALGVYDEAIAEHTAAYRIMDDPALLYNIAQAHRLASHPAEALRFYKVYLTLRPSAANRDDVEAKIAELQRLLELQEKTATTIPQESATPPAEISRPASTAEPRLRPTARREPEPAMAMDGHPGRTEKITGVAVTGAGVAALAAGIALGAFGIVGPALIGVGAAAVVAGAVVALIGLKQSRRTGASVGGAGLLRWSF